ncbi:hypothetical protein H311_01983, partial [Anncaliia algerae PRA109]
MDDQKAKIIKILENVLSTNLELRSSAEEMINELQNKNYQGFFTLLIQILTEDFASPSVQHTAGLILKNSLHSNDPATQNQIEERWISLDNNFRQQIKNHLIYLMSTQKIRTAFLSCNILSGIARIEMTRNQYNDFFTLLNSLLEEKNETLIRCILELVGITCLSLIEETTFDFTKYSGAIFMICLKKMKKEESFEIKNNALKCTNSCLEALENVLNDERNILLLLDALIDISTGKEDELITWSMKVIYRMLGLYYKYMGNNFNKLFLFIQSMQNYESEQVSMEVLEFWTVLAEIECELETNYYTERSLTIFLPYVLTKLIKTDEQMEDVWNSHKAATTALEKISKTVSFELINHPIIIEFLRSNLKNNEEQLELAFIALGSIINRKIENRESIVTLIPVLAKNLNNTKLQKSAFWTLTKISENNFDMIEPVRLLPEVINSSLEVIKNKNDASIYAACLISSMGTYVGRERNVTWVYENVLTFFLPDIFKAVISEIESVDLNNFKLRTSLFSCLHACINSASVDSSGYLLGNALEYFISKSSDCLQNASNTNVFLI